MYLDSLEKVGKDGDSVWLQDHTQELTWQLGEAQRRTAEVQRERDQVKAEIEQSLQTVRGAEAHSPRPMHATEIHTALILRACHKENSTANRWISRCWLMGS